MDPEENPVTVKLNVNRENMGFEDCDDVDPMVTQELNPSDLRCRTFSTEVCEVSV